MLCDMSRVFVLIFALAAWPFVSLIARNAAEDEAIALDQPGLVVMIRHALAPGTGDPAGFDLRNRGTQRNLNDVGRAEARAIGKKLRAAGIGNARVFTSEWWRCRETAELLGLGGVQSLPALNSFFADPSMRDQAMRALREFFEGLPAAGRPIVLVTHQVNITALTGVVPRPGDGVLLRLNGTGDPEYLGPFR